VSDNQVGFCQMHYLPMPCRHCPGVLSILWWHPWQFQESGKISGEIIRLKGIIERAKELHEPDYGHCRTCSGPSPCPTLSVLSDA
jgi:hypothetical protein